MSSGESVRDRILNAAMHAFLERGFAETTTLEIASRARVSKRELYALVGNKEEMLAACIAERGNRMRLPEGFPNPTDRRTLEGALRRYGATLLRELVDPGVVAVFRLGIAEVKRSPAIARSIDARGRQPARAALEALLRSARASNLLVEADLEEMMSQFRGVLWGDHYIWLLLGLAKAPTAKEIERHAEKAAAFFMRAYAR